MHLPGGSKYCWSLILPCCKGSKAAWPDHRRRPSACSATDLYDCKNRASAASIPATILVGAIPPATWRAVSPEGPRQYRYFPRPAFAVTMNFTGPCQGTYGKPIRPLCNTLHYASLKTLQDLASAGLQYSSNGSGGAIMAQAVRSAAVGLRRDRLYGVPAVIADVAQSMAIVRSLHVCRPGNPRHAELPACHDVE